MILKLGFYQLTPAVRCVLCWARAGRCSCGVKMAGRNSHCHCAPQRPVAGRTTPQCADVHGCACRHRCFARQHAANMQGPSKHGNDGGGDVARLLACVVACAFSRCGCCQALFVVCPLVRIMMLPVNANHKQRPSAAAAACIGAAACCRAARALLSAVAAVARRHCHQQGAGGGGRA